MIRLAVLAAGCLFLLGCEHDEHPFEIPWTGSCTALPAASAVTARFSEPFWEDDAGNRRRYTGELQVPLDTGLHDGWLWEVGINLREESARTLALTQVPIPESFTQAYDLQPLGLDPETYAEDPGGAFAEMTGTCSWGSETGELFLRMDDDCDACISCGTVSGPSGWWLLPGALALLTRRRASPPPPAAARGRIRREGRAPRR